MTNQYLLEYFEEIKIVKHFQNLLQKLCGLELEIRKLDGTPIKFSSILKIPTPISLKPFHSNSCACDFKSKNCLKIQSDVLSQVIFSKQPQQFVCSGRFKKILLPIVVNEEVVGLLFSGENSSVRLDYSRMESISELLMDFVQYILKNEMNLLTHFKGSKLTHQQVLLNRAIRYMKENYNRRLSLKQVASDNGVSYYYLSRLFQKELKTTFAQFRNKVRMDIATKLLKDRRTTIHQISSACGFDDPGYFCKVFKNVFGDSPESFRRKKINREQRIPIRKQIFPLQRKYIKVR